MTSDNVWSPDRPLPVCLSYTTLNFLYSVQMVLDSAQPIHYAMQIRFSRPCSDRIHREFCSAAADALSMGVAPSALSFFSVASRWCSITRRFLKYVTCNRDRQPSMIIPFLSNPPYTIVSTAKQYTDGHLCLSRSISITLHSLSSSSHAHRRTKKGKLESTYPTRCTICLELF